MQPLLSNKQLLAISIDMLAVAIIFRSTYHHAMNNETTKLRLICLHKHIHYKTNFYTVFRILLVQYFSPVSYMDMIQALSTKTTVPQLLLQSLSVGGSEIGVPGHQRNGSARLKDI